MCVMEQREAEHSFPNRNKLAEDAISYVKDELRNKDLYGRREVTQSHLKALMNSAKRNKKDMLIDWAIGPPWGRVRCCKFAFAETHGYVIRQINNLLKDIRDGIHRFDRPLSMATKASKSDRNPMLASIQANGELGISEADFGLLACETDEDHMMAIAWLDDELAFRADFMPTGLDRYELEPVTKNAIYEDYKRDMEIYGRFENLLSAQQFYNLWRQRYAHVSIKKDKTVGGKCNVCAAVLQKRDCYTNDKQRNYIKQIFLFHKITFMKERRSYYGRKMLALEKPREYLSMITDGMDQSHCKLPYMKGIAEPAASLTVKLQGMITHFNRRSLIRSFANIKKNANLIIHIWLMELENIYVANANYLPDTIFLQIDGGAENSNKTVLAMCEFLVAKRLVKHIVVTRLPPGHTHEDIDAMFGSISQNCKKHFVYSPQRHEELICEAFKDTKNNISNVKSSITTTVTDLWAVLNYVEALQPYVDSNFSRYSKTENAQLVWLFDAIEMSPDFPSGVQVRYRAYSSDDVVEIYSKERIPGFNHCVSSEGISLDDIPFIPVGLHVESFPGATDSRPIPGMHLLSEIPILNNIQMEPFVQGSSVEVQRAINTISMAMPEHSAQWQEWRSTIPISDDCEAYRHLLRVPFKDLLFSESLVVPDRSIDKSTTSMPVTDFMGSSMLRASSVPSVQWKHNTVDVSPRVLHNHPSLSSLQIEPQFQTVLRNANLQDRRSRRTGWDRFTRTELITKGIIRFTKPQLSEKVTLIAAGKTFKTLNRSQVIQVFEAFGLGSDDIDIEIDHVQAVEYHRENMIDDMIGEADET